MLIVVRTRRRDGRAVWTRVQMDCMQQKGRMQAAIRVTAVRNRADTKDAYVNSLMPPVASGMPHLPYKPQPKQIETAYFPGVTSEQLALCAALKRLEKTASSASLEEKAARASDADTDLHEEQAAQKSLRDTLALQ